MPDNYFTITDEKGSIHISEDVITAITANAVSEADGIAGLSNTAGTGLGERITGKTAAKGIRVRFEEACVAIDVSVLVRGGVSIAAAGEKLQKSVAAAVDSMTGLKAEVNVHVAGISFDK